MLLSLGIAAGCQTKTTYPKFINNQTDEGSNSKREKYNVHVLSEGGAKLDNVKVTVKNAEGTVLRRSISSKGLIELNLPLGEYTLEVDEASLPAGYHLTTSTYKTNPNTREDVTIRIPSRLIGANESGCTYALGGIMKDFTFTDYNGRQRTLSDILEGKNGEVKKSAVVLNFFYTACGPCRSEFPAMETAYTRSPDIEILAICSTHQGDNNPAVKTFAENLGLTFPMGVDTNGLVSAFGVANFPTTFVVDRYGMIAYRSVGSETKASAWAALFNKYTASNYVQSTSTGGDGGTEPGQSDAQKPTFTMPSSAEMDAAASVEGLPLNATYRNDDNEYSWPWLAGSDDEGSYIYSSNKGIDNSFASVFISEIEMKKDDVLMLEYKVDSESDSDLLYITVDGIILNGEGYSAVTEWTPLTAYVADRDKKVELSFTFRKDAGDPDEFTGEDQAKVRNIHIEDSSSIVEPTDVLRTCASGEEIYEGKTVKYSHYTDVVLCDDGFYHVGDENGPLVYISIIQLTPWNDLHTNGNITNVNDSEFYYNTLYMLTYYMYSSYDQFDNFHAEIDGVDLTQTVLSYQAIASYMEYPYCLLPVNVKLREWAEKFVEVYEPEANGAQAHDKEWLEFCYYYDHYGAEHGKNDGCRENTDRTRGLTIYNSYDAYEKNDPELKNAEMYNAKTGRIIAEINYPLLLNNGTYYKFVPKKTGVYQIRSYISDYSSKEVEPDFALMNENGKLIYNSEFIRDFDYLLPKGQGRVDYEGYNEYFKFEAGKTYFLFPMVYPETTGYYEFEVEYLGETHQTLYSASLYAGAWSSATRYSAIEVVLDEDPLTGEKIYYKKGADGQANHEQPIYISMIHESYLYSEIPGSTHQTIEWLYNYGAWDPMNMINGDYYGNIIKQNLDKAKANEDGIVDGKGQPIVGLVKATVQLVEALNQFVDYYIDPEVGRGEGNAWLTFACYMEMWG